MSNQKDLTGKKFGRWTVLKYAGKGSGKWTCKCDCGTIKDVKTANLTHGWSISCGCYREEKCIKAVTTHGQSRTKLYKVWNSMKQRCENSKIKYYKNYGARGICVCEEWKDFSNFYKWAIEHDYYNLKRPTIERINNDGNYCPDNCKWTTFLKQAYNKRISNPSGIRGISWSVKRKAWVAQFWYKGKPYYVGQFKDIEQAKFELLKKRKETIIF